MVTMSIIGIFLGLALLVVLALRGYHIVLLALAASLVVILFSGQDVLKMMSGPYMKGFVGFAQKFYLLFFISAVFAKTMEDSGAARAIADLILKALGAENKIRVLLAVFLITGIITYGGINVFVAIFVIVPIARGLFNKLNIPWHLFIIPFAWGGATITMTMIPGTPQIQNLIPTKYLGTTPMAGAAIGIIAAIVTSALAYWYMTRALKACESAGEGYMTGEGYVTAGKSQQPAIEVTAANGKTRSNGWLALLPPLGALLSMNVLKWDPLYAISLATVLTIVLFWNKYDSILKTINQGALNTITPIMNTSADVGFGSVVAAVSGFAVISQWLMSIPGSPTISLAIVTNVLVAITGSASGGLGIAMEALSAKYLTTGVDPAIIHRIAAIASSGFDAMPHNGAVITFFAVAGLTHRNAYKHVFFTAVLAPVGGLIAVLLLLPLLI